MERSPGFGSKPIKPENTNALEGHYLALNLCHIMFLNGFVTNLSWWKTDIHIWEIISIMVLYCIHENTTHSF